MITAFRDVDAADDPSAFLGYLQRVEALAPMAAVRQHTYEIAGRQPGPGVDVGCGSGRAVADLAARGIDVIGVDRSQAMIEAARARFPGHRFSQGDATALPLTDSSMSWYRAERMFLHLADPLPVLAEARRVLSRQGVIVLADQDFDSTIVTTADAGLTRNIVAAFTDSLPHGQAGSAARGLLADAGFTNIEVSVLPLMFEDFAIVEPLIVQPAVSAALKAGAVTDAQARHWLADLRTRADNGRFLAAVTMFVTTARQR